MGPAPPASSNPAIKILRPTNVFNKIRAVNYEQIFFKKAGVKISLTFALPLP
jgi:hypothetical protein